MDPRINTDKPSPKPGSAQRPVVLDATPDRRFRLPLPWLERQVATWLKGGLGIHRTAKLDEAWIGRQRAEAKRLAGGMEEGAKGRGGLVEFLGLRAKPRRLRRSASRLGREPKRLFLAVLLVMIALTFAFACVGVWIIYPRLSQFSSRLGDAALAGVLAFSAALFLPYAFLTGALVTGRGTRLAVRIDCRLPYLRTLAFWVARRLGVSPARLARSLAEVHAEVTRRRLARASAGQVIVIMGCGSTEAGASDGRGNGTSAGDQGKLRALCSEYGVLFQPMPSLESAMEGMAWWRDFVSTWRPAAVVAVGCAPEWIEVARQACPSYRVPVVVAKGKAEACGQGAPNRCLDLAALRRAVMVAKTRFEVAA